MSEFKLLIKPGFKLNPNDKLVKGIIKGIERCGGACPCSHSEWDENTPDEDKQCPCITYRKCNECHCNLYILE